MAANVAFPDAAPKQVVAQDSQEVGMNAPLAEWANFFVAEVGASAALAGLVVVATSINLSRILLFPQLPA